MPIKLTLSRGSMKTEAVLKDGALTDLMLLIQKYESDGIPTNESNTPKPAAATHQERNNGTVDDSIGKVKKWLASHTASEVLNRLGWETYPDKILLLGAHHEAHGGEEGWKSAEIGTQFANAKEPFPKNFPRDIRSAIVSGVIGGVTPRSYKVGRAGWNKIADGIAALNE